MKVGFVGLGNMGMPMVLRLIGAGLEVVAWNRSEEKLARLVAHGAARAGSPAELMARVDLIGVCLTSHEAVEEVAWGRNGLFSAQFRGQKVVADFSTGSADAARSFAKRAAARGVGWVDIPVSGGVEGASNGTLVAFAGGDPNAIAMLNPILIPLCTRVSGMGPSGMGQATKLCNQMMVACNLLVLAEAMAMARRVGVDVSALPEALKGGWADSRPLQILGPRMANHRFEPGLATLALMAKDVRLAAQLGGDHGARTPNLDLARELYASASADAAGGGSADLSSLVCLFESVSAAS